MALRMRSWIRQRFATPTRCPFRKTPPACRPAVEALEDRLAPATFTVNTLADNPSAGSLRWAITQANTVAGDDTITFSVTGTINLTGVLPDLDSNLAIQGPGAGSLTVRRDTGGDYRIFWVPFRRTADLSGITIANGFSDNGGGIYNEGALTVSNSTLSGNSAFSGSGGGIRNLGTLTVSNGTFSGNSATSNGGAISNESFATLAATLTVSNSTLSGNSAGVGGSGGSGGGVYNQGTLTVSNSTLSGNSAFSGGGIWNEFYATVTVSNSTLSANSATNSGGGIYNNASFGVGGTLTVSNSTLSGNSAGAGFGGGIRSLSGSVTLNNSLVVNSVTGGDVVGTFTGSNNRTGALPLGPLQFNGGPTRTHALPAGSPAINAGNNALIPVGVTTDQRGAPFARISAGTVDIGAFEVQSITVTWSGAGADGNWTTSANWQGGAAPAPGDDLVFPAGAARLSNTNTFAAGTAFRSLTLAGASYALGGNALTLTNGLTAAAAGANTVALPLNLGAAQALTAAAGAQLTLSGAVTGSFAVTLGGAGQLTVAGTLTVPSVSVTAGTLSVASPVRVATFTNTGGTVTIADPGYVDATGTYGQTAGRTTLNNSGIRAALTDLQGGILDGAGFGLILGNLRNAARIDVGGAGAVGSLFVVGNYTQTAAGILNVDLAGSTLLGNYDFFYVDGTASLAGTLNVNRLNGYVPNPDDLFVPVFSGGLTSGTFDIINGLILSPTRTLVAIYFENGLALFAT